MTKLERHEIAVTVKAIIEDECDEIRSKYQKLYGSLKGFRDHIRRECIEFWSNGEPYLDEEYCDFEWIKLGDHIINLDDCWCMIRDNLQYDIENS